MNECYEQFLYGKSNRFDSKEKLCNHFDIVIFSSGWESRCKEIINHNSENFEFDESIILTFSQNNTSGSNEDFVKELETFSFSKGKKPTRINLNEDNKIPATIFPITQLPDQNFQIEDNIGKIMSKISSIIKERKEPVTIGFDISCCPRRYFLSVLGYLIKLNQIKKIAFFYSEGLYPPGRDFSKGKWEIAAIPIFGNKFDPDKSKRYYVVSAGFERNRYRAIISNDQPDLVGLLLPNPGFTDEYSKLIKELSKPLIDECKIPDNRIANVMAGDAIAAWEVLKKPEFNDPEYQVTYLPFGPKPHVLAMGLHGLLNNNILMTYRLPEGGYTKTEVKSNGILWSYEISNLLH